MMSKLIFSEKQRIDSILPLSLAAIVLVFDWWLYFIKGYPDLNLFYGSLVMVGLVSLFMGLMKLETQIYSDQIRYKFSPFKRKWQIIYKQDIRSYTIREYKAFKEYGGRGHRYGKSGRAMTLGGKSGLQLIMNGDEKILIGTQKPEEMEKALGGWRK